MHQYSSTLKYWIVLLTCLLENPNSVQVHQPWVHDNWKYIHYVIHVCIYSGWYASAKISKYQYMQYLRKSTMVLKQALPQICTMQCSYVLSQYSHINHVRGDKYKLEYWQKNIPKITKTWLGIWLIWVRYIKGGAHSTRSNNCLGLLCFAGAECQLWSVVKTFWRNNLFWH